MRKLISKSVKANEAQYIGRKDEIFLTTNQELKVSDGLTPGGLPLQVDPVLINPVYYIVEQDYVSSIVQNPSSLDVPVQVSYGTGATSTNGIISVDAQGTITCLKSGPLFFKTRHRVGRSGASGISHVFQWIETSLNGGTTWIKIGNSISVSLDNSNDVAFFFDSTPFFMQAGQKLRSMIARSSLGGSNSGGLLPEQPSAALLALGVNVSPSAQLTIYRLENWNYI